MTYTIIISPRADRDFDRLETWLVERDPKAATRLGALLEKAIGGLAASPLRGRSIGPATREINIPFGHSAYIIRYRVKGQRVIITRIWHGLEQR